MSPLVTLVSNVMSHNIDHYGSDSVPLSTHVTHICFANVILKPECYCKMLLWDHHCVRWELHGWVGQLLSWGFCGWTLWHQPDLLLGGRDVLWLGVGCLMMGCGVTVQWVWFRGQRSEDAWIISMHR